MKRIALLLAALLLLGSFIGCAAAQPETPPETEAPAGTDAPETEAPETEAPEAPVSEAEYLPDFTVQTIDGGSFTLSEALSEHELVIVNLFATWCGPCGSEFPFLQEAWEQSADRVAVVALSVEPTDTDEVLQAYAAIKGLTFPIGHESGTGLSRFVTTGIPTTLVVDRTGKVAAVEIGAKTSTKSFLDLFNGYTGEDYDPDVCTYTVWVYDSNRNGIEGVVINFCTDATCTAVTTNESGKATFTGPPTRYHVQVLSVPAGLEASETEFTTEPYAQTFRIACVEAG